MLLANICQTGQTEGHAVEKNVLNVISDPRSGLHSLWVTPIGYTRVWLKHMSQGKSSENFIRGDLITSPWPRFLVRALLALMRRGWVKFSWHYKWEWTASPNSQVKTIHFGKQNGVSAFILFPFSPLPEHYINHFPSLKTTSALDLSQTVVGWTRCQKTPSDV